MSNYWLTKVSLILIALLIAVSCDTQVKNQPESDLEELQGKILIWAEIPANIEIPTNSDNVQEAPKGIYVHNRIEEFKEIYPQVQVFVKYFPQGEIIEPFELEAGRGSGPDILIARSDHQILRLINNKELRAIDKFEINYSQFSDETIKQTRYQDKIYGLPIYLSTQVLCYNQDKVKEIPKTLQDLIEQARKGYSVGLVSNIYDSFWGTGIFGGRLFDDSGQFNLSADGGWIRWMKWLKEAQNEPNFVLSNKKEKLEQAFMAGQLAYLTCHSDAIPYFVETMGKDKLGVALLPSKENHPATPLLRVGVAFFNRYSTANQTRLAIKLAQFLSSREQQEQVQASIHFIPSNKNTNLNRHLFPLRAIMLDQSKTAISVALDDLENVQEFSFYANSIYQKVLEGEMPPEQAASELTKILNGQRDPAIPSSRIEISGATPLAELYPKGLGSPD